MKQENVCCKEEIEVIEDCDENDVKMEAWVNSDGSIEMHLKMGNRKAFNKLAEIMHDLFEYCM